MRFTRHPDSLWSHLHVHSTYSSGDALSSVPTLVAAARTNGQPALGLTDHGNMSGTVALYTECAKAGIMPLPGSEFYLVRDRADKKAKRFHLGVLATTTQGYRNLVALSSASHRNFYRKPLLDLSDLAEASEAGRLQGLVVLSGCYSGLPIQDLLNYGPEQAMTDLGMYARWFDQCYVEIMNHEITWPDGSTDTDLCDALVDLAARLGLPVLVTGDVHYARAEQHHLHDSLKRLVSYGSGDDDGVFSGHGYDLAATATVKAKHSSRNWIGGLAGIADLLQRWDLSIPALDHYSYNIPLITPEPQRELVRRVGVEPPVLAEELEVLDRTGMAGYLLLVAEVTDYLRREGIQFQARGSASGSLACYRLGITAVDPVRWKLRYERFITTDRTKPPDIDLDVEYARRGEVLAWLRQRFSVHHIGTYLELSMSDQDEGKGSLVVKYMAKARARAKERGEQPPPWDAVPEDVKTSLFALARSGVTSGYGVHAAGLVLTTSDAEFEALVPTMYVASSKTTVSQYTMGDIEKLGLVKLDLLGLRALSTIRGTLESLGRDPRAGLDWIPVNDHDTFDTVRRGDTIGVFQFDGYTNRRGGQEMKVASVSDIIAVQALYRPAVMNGGTTEAFIRRRRHQEKTPKQHPLLARSLQETYGLVVYQEQVIEILRALGMNPDDLTALLKAVKASNNNVAAAAEVISSYGSDVYRMCAAKAVPDEEANMLWRAIEGFAEYGFNRCASGNSVLLMSTTADAQMTRGGASQHSTIEMSVREFYDVFHGLATPTRSKYRAASKGLFVAAHAEGRIKLDRVKDVHFTGVQPVKTVRLGDGREITTTGNHRHLTRRGWVMVDDLMVGQDMVATMGPYEHYVAPTGGLPSVKSGRLDAYRALPAYCQFCGATEGRLEIAHLNHDRTDNSAENIRRLCNSCHKQHDYDTGRRVRRWAKGRSIIWQTVVSVTDAGVTDTYDLEMAGEDHSWVANGIVTHNSHATMYGLTAYRTAYLKTHYPVPYFAALLASFEGTKDKEPWYRSAARAHGVKIKAPMVGVSGSHYTYDPSTNSVRRGLRSIRGVGAVAADHIAVHGPYTDLADLIVKCGTRPVTGGRGYLASRNPGDLCGTLAALYEAGALDGLLNNMVPA